MQKRARAVPWRAAVKVAAVVLALQLSGPYPGAEDRCECASRRAFRAGREGAVADTSAVETPVGRRFRAAVG